MATQKSPVQQLIDFNKNTRKYIQPITTFNAVEGGQYKVQIPKSRLLAGLKIRITATLTATHAANVTYTPHEDAPMNFLRSVMLNTNQGFIPYSLSGQALFLENLSQYGAPKMVVDTTFPTRSRLCQEVVAAAGGAANDIVINADLNNMINKRDSIGLINLAYPEANVALDINLGTVADLAPAAAGYTFALTNIVVSVTGETFSIPNDLNNLPPLNSFKLVNELSGDLINGENTIRIATGQTIRKMYLMVYTAAPVRIADAVITSDFQIILDQADYPIRQSVDNLNIENNDNYDGACPIGTYIFDFSSQGIRNMGGTRDLINTSKLKEFWLRFTSNGAASYRLAVESLATIGQ